MDKLIDQTREIESNKTAESRLLEIINAYKKENTSKIVVPCMSVMVLLFHIMYFRAESIVYILWAYSVPLVALNIYLSEPKQVTLFGRSFSSRNDVLDFWRWVMNLVILDLPAVLIMRPDEGVFFGIWFIILWAAKSDTVGNIYSKALMIMGVVCFLAAGFVLGHENWAMNAAFLTILIVGFMMYDHAWTKDIIANQDLRSGVQRLENTMDGMKRDAMLGMNAAIVTHELRGPTTILSMLLQKIKSGKSIENSEKNIERFQLALDKIENVIGLVLNLKKVSSRATTFRIVVRDIDLLSRKALFDNSPVGLFVESDHMEVGIVERTSSLYFILHNLIKNSEEALRVYQKPGSAWVKIWTELSEDMNTLLVNVEDNGPGLPKKSIEKIKNQSLESGSNTGHGIGLKFVVRECLTNNFSFDLTSSESGTCFTIGVVTTLNMNTAELEKILEAS